ncbi:MAG: hypothetical protein E2P02_27685 [Acidobacteria bacterium]|nr:MAG: hypothetical protein E2P02_27685 [Acidobacteriota bacterium]
MDTLLHSETPVEYFKEVVEKVMARQNFRSSELSSFYLVKLLENFVAIERYEAGLEATIAELYCEALRSRGRARFTKLKLTGDVALFVSGFFADSISRRRVELDYYMRMGGTAYGRAAGLSPRDAGAVFVELSQKFRRFVDVLNEVSEESALTDAPSILRLYGRWLESGSERSKRLLEREGILLDRSAKQVH